MSNANGTVIKYEHPPEEILKDTAQIHQFREDQLKHRAWEVEQTINMIKSNVMPFNFKDLYLMGHSFGGVTSIFCGATIPEIVKGIIALDPWLYPLPASFIPNPTVPLLVINSETFSWPGNKENLLQVLEATRSFACTIKGSGHMDQSDFSLIIPKWVSSRYRKGDMEDPEKIMQLNHYLIEKFLQQEIILPLEGVICDRNSLNL